MKYIKLNFTVSDFEKATLEIIALAENAYSILYILLVKGLTPLYKLGKYM